MKITGRNVNELFHNALWNMKTSGRIEKSRAGKVRVIPEPVLLECLRPRERVLFCEERHENPIFHFMESLWMLAGRKDASWIGQWNPRMHEFAEADHNFHGAYGWRWREHFALDQILVVARMLRNDPTTRRAVIQMWSVVDDLDMDAKDLPCNTHIYFRVQGKTLHMTVCNRSNDLVWGALGSNIVHFSFLHELIAKGAGLQVGTMFQFTNNLHIYERHWHFLDVPPDCEQYIDLEVTPFPLMEGNLPTWLRECERFTRGQFHYMKESFFTGVAIPMIQGRVDDIKAKDWQLAVKRYLERIKTKPQAGVALPTP